MREVVKRNKSGTQIQINEIASEFPAIEHIDSLIDAVNQDLDHFYEGNYARYRLKLSELKSWKFRRTNI